MVASSSTKGGDKAAKNSLEKQGLLAGPRVGEGEVGWGRPVVLNICFLFLVAKHFFSNEI